MSETALPVLRSRAESRALVALGVLGFVELILFLLGLAMGAQGEDVLILLLALATVFVGAFPVLVDIGRPPEKRQILITLLVLVYMIFLVVPIFTNYFLGKGEYVPGLFRLNSRQPSEVAHAQLVALLGLAMLLIGFYSPFGRIATAGLPKPTRDWPPFAALGVSTLTLVMGWMILIPGQLGFLPAWSGTGALGVLAAGTDFGIALLTLTFLRYRRREALLLLAIVVPLSMFLAFFTGSKTRFLTPPFMIVLAYIVFEHRIRMSWVAVGLGALIVLYPVSEFYRQMVRRDNAAAGIQTFVRDPGKVLSALTQFGKNADLGDYVSDGLQATGDRLDALGTLAVIVTDTPDRVPYQGGWTLANIPLSYIPRALWPAKPDMGIGRWVSQTYGSPWDLKTSIGPSWIGELYLNWGYIGVVCGMLTMGLLCRLLQEFFFGWNAPIPAMFVAVIALYCIVRTVQASLLAPVNGTIFHITPVLFAHFFVGLFSGFVRPLPAGRSRSTGAVAPASPAARA